MHIDGGESWRIDSGNYSLPEVLPAQQSEFCFQLTPLRLWVSVILLQGKHSALCLLASAVTQQSWLRCSCCSLRQRCDMCLLMPVLAASCSHLEAAHWHPLLIFPKANCRKSCTCKSPVSVETLKTGEAHSCRVQLEKCFCSIGEHFVGTVHLS